MVCTLRWPSSLPIIGRLSPKDRALDAKECRRSWMRTSSSPAFFRTTPHVCVQIAQASAEPTPGNDPRVVRLAGAERSAPASPSVTGGQRVRRSSRRASESRRARGRRPPIAVSGFHCAGIRSASAAGALPLPSLRSCPSSSSSSSTVPSRRNSRSDRKRSQLRVGYFLINRQGLPPSGA